MFIFRCFSRLPGTTKVSVTYRDAVAPEVYDAVLGAVLTAIKRLDLRYTYGTPEEGGRCEKPVLSPFLLLLMVVLPGYDCCCFC